MALSAPPDKDPVMLLNEYGQKRGQLVSTNSGTYTSSRAFFCLPLNQRGLRMLCLKACLQGERVTLVLGLP